MVSKKLEGQHTRVRTQEAAAAAAVSWMMFSCMQRFITLCWHSKLSAITIDIRGVVVGPVAVVVVVASAVCVCCWCCHSDFSRGFSSKNSSKKETWRQIFIMLSRAISHLRQKPIFLEITTFKIIASYWTNIPKNQIDLFALKRINFSCAMARLRG